jgi:hypothetical protein
MADIRLNVSFDTDDVQSMLDRALNAIQPPALTESLGLGADVFVAAERETVPVGTDDWDKHQGQLRDSIEKTQDGDGWIVAPGGESDGILYAGTQNFGATMNAKTPFGMRFMIGPVWHVRQTVTIPAQDYVQKAFDAGEDEAAAAVIESIQSNIDQA